MWNQLINNPRKRRLALIGIFWGGLIALLLAFSSPEAAEPPSSEPPTKQETPLSAKTPPTENTGGAEVDRSKIIPSKMPWNFQKPLKVGVVFLVNEISKINEVSGNFEASIDLQLSWNDPNLVFDAKTIGSERIILNMDEATKKLATIWNPDIVIANMNDKPTSLQPSLIIKSDGTVVYIQRIKGLFESPYKLAAFPFDGQALLIRLISTTYDASLLQFTQSQENIDHSGFREGISLNGWNLKDVEYMTSNVRGLNGNYFSQFKADVIMTRKPVSHLFYLAPLLLIVFVPTILTFYASADVSTRLNNWAGSMLALIALSFTLTLRYPALPSDGILAQMIAIVFGYQFVMICLCKSVLDPEVQKSAKNPYMLPVLIDFMRWSVPIVLMIIIIARILLTSLEDA